MSTAGTSDGRTERKEQDMEEQDTNVNIYNWGPCLMKCTITNELKELLLSEAKVGFDYKDKLAGIIEKETGYTDQSKDKILPHLSKCFGLYDQAQEYYKREKFKQKPEYIMSALWINYQKQHEFNPPHDHDGAISFVIYLQIPDELKKENEAYVGKSGGPGGIQFFYGDGTRDAITYMSHFPKERDMFIFPAWLKHWVNPFKSDCTRISVSGNIHDSAKINNIKLDDYKKDNSKT
jgi:hypothetical protein